MLRIVNFTFERKVIDAGLARAIQSGPLVLDLYVD